MRARCCGCTGAFQALRASSILVARLRSRNTPLDGVLRGSRPFGRFALCVLASGAFRASRSAVQRCTAFRASRSSCSLRRIYCLFVTCMEAASVGGAER